MIGQAIEENNEKLSQDISRMVNDKVLKEIDYLMRVADERDEERFRQLDETIRLYQKEIKGGRKPRRRKHRFCRRSSERKKFGTQCKNKFREEEDSGSESTEKKAAVLLGTTAFMY